jgi:hypothetical protein
MVKVGRGALQRTRFGIGRTGRSSVTKVAYPEAVSSTEPTFLSRSLEPVEITAVAAARGHRIAGSTVSVSPSENTRTAWSLIARPTGSVRSTSGNG